MPRRLREPVSAFLQRWLITTLAVLVAAQVVKGIHCDTVAGLFVASLLLGVLNAFVRPVMLVLSLPLLIATLGLFVLVINAFLLYLVGHLVKSFHIDSFGAAVWGSLAISVTSLAVNLLTGRRDSQVEWRSNRQRRPPRGNGEGGGPVIDV